MRLPCGVYAQLTTSRGETVDRYYNIPVDSLDEASTSSTNNKDLGEQARRVYILNLDISDFKEVPLGKFCISYCIYRGNSVSTAIIGCATIDCLKNDNSDECLKDEKGEITKLLKTVEIVTF